MQPECSTTAIVTREFLGSVCDLSEQDGREVLNALLLLMANPQDARLRREPFGTDGVHSIKAGNSCRILFSGDRETKLLSAGSGDVLRRFAAQTRADATAFAEAPIAFQLHIDFWQGEPLAGFETPSCGVPVGPEYVAGLLGARTYLPLAHLLLSRGAEVSSLVLSICEIETVLGKALPAAAQTDAIWWANDRNHVQANVWMALGWNVTSIDLQQRKVTFARAPRKTPV